MTNLDWMDEALCATHPDPDLFFPSLTGVPGQRQSQEARRVCRSCPVRVQCAEHRTTVGASAGIWGGCK